MHLIPKIKTGHVSIGVVCLTVISMFLAMRSDAQQVSIVLCSFCLGNGKIVTAPPWIDFFGNWHPPATVTCFNCKGSGKVQVIQQQPSFRGSSTPTIQSDYTKSCKKKNLTGGPCACTAYTAFGGYWGGSGNCLDKRCKHPKSNHD